MSLLRTQGRCGCLSLRHPPMLPLPVSYFIMLGQEVGNRRQEGPKDLLPRDLCTGQWAGKFLSLPFPTLSFCSLFLLLPFFLFLLAEKEAPPPTQRGSPRAPTGVVSSTPEIQEGGIGRDLGTAGH